MRKRVLLIFCFIAASVQSGFSQDFPQQKLDSITITSARIALPFKKNSRTINVITSEDIKNSAAVNVADLLQQVAGVDIRRRGTGGSQADLYIRGGGFDQTLLLIDGVKMDDAQTGHHTMNAALPIEVIERIEIVKGPAARVFGQNAFTGAINIVTKKSLENTVSANLELGSFHQLNGNVTAGIELDNSSHILHAGKVSSAGYRNNSDYDNSNYFYKSTFNKATLPIDIIATFMERRFGAQNFYTNNPSFNEYEETQNSLVAFSTSIITNNLKIQPRVYWRRNQDIFLLRRFEPAFYRNFHITNKVGAEANASYASKLGITGFGLDLSQYYISSNNLGERQRFMATVFLEHRFNLIDGRLDVTPGAALTYFSDFNFRAFPGLDIGFEITPDLRAYGNIGYTYRIPTYTDLYYNDPVTSGNPDLEPEEAFAQELGIKYLGGKWSLTLALFNRDSENLIDYVRESTGDDVFTATNIREVNTRGLEFDAAYNFKLSKFTQTLSLGYSYIEDDIFEQNEDLSRYSLNTLRNQFTTRLSTRFFKNLSQNLVFKYGERNNGDDFNVLDFSIVYAFKQMQLTLTASNILNEDYIETGFVPMPPSNVLFGLRYNFN
jgi:iron complex outermembrane receptor protein